MKVTRGDAVAVFQSLGYMNAREWSNGLMSKKFEALHGSADFKKRRAVMKNKNLRNLLDAIMACVEEEKEVKVEGELAKATVKPEPKKAAAAAKPKKAPEPEEEEETDEESEDEEESEEDSEDEETEGESEDEDEDESDESEDEEEEEEVVAPPKKKVASKAPVKGGKPSGNGKPAPAKVKKESNVEKDAFGARLGTRTARINAAILKAKKPLSTGEIEAVAKATGISSHLWNLVNNGFAVKTDDKKFALNPKFKVKMK